MLFESLRIVLFLITSVIIFVVIKKTKIVRKKLIIILSIVSCMGLISVSGIFPIENLFINFSSPESVFNYVNSGKIDDVIYGRESCMIIYSKGKDPGGYYIIPKVENGYKIPNYYSTKKQFINLILWEVLMFLLSMERMITIFMD